MGPEVKLFCKVHEKQICQLRIGHDALQSGCGPVSTAITPHRVGWVVDTAFTVKINSPSASMGPEVELCCNIHIKKKCLQRGGQVALQSGQGLVGTANTHHRVGWVVDTTFTVKINSPSASMGPEIELCCKVHIRKKCLQRGGLDALQSG